MCEKNHINIQYYALGPFILWLAYSLPFFPLPSSIFAFAHWHIWAHFAPPPFIWNSFSMHWLKSYASFIRFISFIISTSVKLHGHSFNSQHRFIKLFFLIWYISFLRTIISIGIRSNELNMCALNGNCMLNVCTHHMHHFIIKITAFFSIFERMNTDFSWTFQYISNLVIRFLFISFGTGCLQSY